MAGEPGVAYFTNDYLLGPEYYCNGDWFPACPFSIETSVGVLALPTHGGTHKVQRVYRAVDRPASYDALRFTLTVQAIDESAWYALKRAKAVGAPFYFSTGARRTDKFATTAGQNYKLTRPIATGIIPGISAITHATVISGGTGSVSGQIFSATSTGTAFVEYTPVHWCIFTAFPEDLQIENDLRAAVQLQEILI